MKTPSLYLLALLLSFAVALPFDFPMFTRDRYVGPWAYDHVYRAEYSPLPSYTLTDGSAVDRLKTAPVGSTIIDTDPTSTATGKSDITVTAFPTATGVDKLPQPLPTAFSFPTGSGFAPATIAGTDLSLPTGALPLGIQEGNSKRFEGPRKRDDHHRHYPYMPPSAVIPTASAMPTASAPSASVSIAATTSLFQLPMLAR